MTDTDVLITPDELAALLRTTKTAVYTAAERGKIPGVRKLGRRLLFHRATITAWIDTGEVPRARRGSVRAGTEAASPGK